MWILHKINKAQCIYTSCIPPRLSYTTGMALSFYRMRGQCVKICVLIRQLGRQWRYAGLNCCGGIVKSLSVPPSHLDVRA
jgi:hypothetical protein